MSKHKMHDASINMTFARTMRILTWIGLIVLFVFGIFYLFGVNVKYGPSLIMQNWDKPASQFWLEVKGQEARGYAWFLSFVPSMDSLAMTGIMLLLLTPLITLMFAVWHLKGMYLVLVLILIVEFLFSVFRPLL